MNTESNRPPQFVLRIERNDRWFTLISWDYNLDVRTKILVTDNYLYAVRQLQICMLLINKDWFRLVKESYREGDEFVIFEPIKSIKVEAENLVVGGC